MRIKTLFVFWATLFIPLSVSLASPNASTLGLKLQCVVTFSNYDNVESNSVSKSVTLTNFKHKKGGASLVTQTDKYEFWAMVHSVQTINNQRFINNFQVAVKNKTNGTFMHALSDSTYAPGKLPKQARLSLVDYPPDSFLEKGELLFECKSHK